MEFIKNVLTVETQFITSQKLPERSVKGLQ